MEKYQEIEKSITRTYRNKIWAKFVKAIKTYELLQPNDHVCVCISGGKDSMLMAKLFQILHRYTDFQFDVTYLVMNPGYNEINLQTIKHNLSLMNIDAEIAETNIFEVSTSIAEKPCYMCAKMRRGALYRLAKERGCNKIALGHHYDDVIETTMMNILNAGSFATMLPKLHSQNFEGMELIRPLYLVREQDIKDWCKDNELTFIACACRLTERIAESEHGDDVSQRLATKHLIHDLLQYNPQVEKNIFKSASNVFLGKILGYKENGVEHTFLEKYDEEIKKEEKVMTETLNPSLKPGMETHPGNDPKYGLATVERLADNILTGKKIMYLGSSVTFGSHSLGVAVADYIAARNGTVMYKEAVSGTLLCDITNKHGDSYITRMKTIDKNLQFDAFVVQLSTNDATKGMEFGEISDSYNLEDFDNKTIAGAIEYIIAYAKQTYNCPVIFYTSAKFENERYQRMVDMLFEIQKKWNIGIVDLWNKISLEDLDKETYDLWMANEIHPTQAGYRQWWTPLFEEELVKLFNR